KRDSFVLKHLIPRNLLISGFAELAKFARKRGFGRFDLQIRYSNSASDIGNEGIQSSHPRTIIVFFSSTPHSITTIRHGFIFASVTVVADSPSGEPPAQGNRLTR